MNKNIEAILLYDNEIKLKEINKLLEQDYKQTIKDMFNILLEYIKKGTNEDIETILSNIETIVISQDSKNYKLISNAVREANYNLNKLKKHQNEKEFKLIKFRLVDLNRKMLTKKEKKENNNLYNFYSYVIFKEKNLDMVDTILKSESNILSKKDEYNNDLLANVIEKYCSLSMNDTELINYYSEVITLFIKKYEDDLIKDNEVYTSLLNRPFCKGKKHIKEITERFNKIYSISSNELEKKYNISSIIDEDVIKESSEFKPNCEGRKFFSGNFITVDEEGAICLDDALSMQKNKDGSFIYYVAITDIPSIVPYGSKTFNNALEKVETIYLTDKKIDLYPSNISEDLGSLLPNEYRNVIMYSFFVDPEYNLNPESIKIEKGIIKVNHKLTYHQVNKEENIDDETKEMLNNMALLTYKLRSQNQVKEKYRKIENLINSNATYHHSIFIDKSASANIIQESMLLVNHLSAQYFLDNGYVYTYRNHLTPTDNYVDKELERLLSSSQIDTNNMEYQKMFSVLKETYLNATYSTQNKGHQGLGYNTYSHSSSAARRFDDAFNQYLTYEQIFKSNITDKKYYELETLAKEVIDYINQKKKENTKFANEYNYLYSKKLIRKR